MEVDSTQNRLEELDARHDDLLEQIDALDEKICAVLESLSRTLKPAENEAVPASS